MEKNLSNQDQKTFSNVLHQIGLKVPALFFKVWNTKQFIASKLNQTWSETRFTNGNLFFSSCIIGTILTASQSSRLEEPSGHWQYQESDPGRKVKIIWKTQDHQEFFPLWFLHLLLRSSTRLPRGSYFFAAGSSSTMSFTN